MTQDTLVRLQKFLDGLKEATEESKKDESAENTALVLAGLGDVADSVNKLHDTMSEVLEELKKVNKLEELKISSQVEDK